MKPKMVSAHFRSLFEKKIACKICTMCVVCGAQEIAHHRIILRGIFAQKPRFTAAHDCASGRSPLVRIRRRRSLGDFYR